VTTLSGFQAGLCAASASLVALLARGHILKGQHIDISEAESWAGVHLGQEVLMSIFQWRVPQRTGNHAVDFPYPNCILPCKDGYVVVGAVEGRQWRKFLELMGDPEWAKDARFRDRTAINSLYAEEADSYLVPWLMQRTKEELFCLARDNGLPFAPVKSADEVVRDQHLEFRGFFIDCMHSETGPLTYPGAPYKFSRTPWSIRRLSPLLGEHNEEIYCKRLGYTREQLGELRDKGVI
jgi:CoA:oxalate CoA-transferase